MDSLRCFLEVARCKSFSRAAEALYTSSSTVSRRVAALEKELGRSLFHRSSQEITLTEAGERLLRKAEEMLRQYDEMKENK